MGRSPAARARRRERKTRACVRADTALALWLSTQSVGTVAKAVGVGRMAVYGWMYGHSAPKPEHARTLIELSAGQLTMDLIYSSRVKGVTT
jgi:hypothetical protein